MTAPADALKLAKRFVMTLPGREALPANVLLDCILTTAEFLAGAATPAEDDDDEELVRDATPDGVTSPTGPLRSIACSVTPTDRATVQGGKLRGRPVVRIDITDGGSISRVVATAEDARRYAGAIFDAADDAEGKSPELGRLLGGITE